MTKTTKIKIIVCLALAFFICLTSYIILSKNESIKVSAYSTGARDSFDLVDGMSLKLDGSQARLFLSVTEEQYESLNQQNHTGSLGLVEYSPGDCIALFRVKDLSKIDDFLSYYDSFSSTMNNRFPTFQTIVGAFAKFCDNDEFLNFYHFYPSEKFPYSQMFLIEGGEMTGYIILPFDVTGDNSIEYYYVTMYVSTTQVSTDLFSQAYYSYTFLSRSSAVQRSFAFVASQALEFEGEGYNQTQIKTLQRLAGVATAESTFKVYVTYQRAISFGFFDLLTETYYVDSLYNLTPTWVFSSVLTASGRNSIYDFNCFLRNSYFVNSSEFVTDTRILLQAKTYEYRYDSVNGCGILDIIYYDFQMKDFCIMVQDNDVSDSNNLTSYIYFTDVTYNSDTNIVTMRLPFEGDDVEHNSVGIKNLLFNSLGWIIDDFSADNFNVSSLPSGISVAITDSELVVSFDRDLESQLVTVSINCNAEIIPDYECIVTINYSELSLLDNDIHVEIKQITDTVMYSDYLRDYINSSAFYALYGEVIDSAITLDVLNGQAFFMYHGVTPSIDGENTFSITVDYTYNTLIKCVTQGSHSVKFYALRKNTLTYTADEFDFGVPDGYELTSLTTPNTSDLRVSFNSSNPLQSTISVISSPNQAKVLTLNATFGKVSADDDSGNPSPLPDDDENPDKENPDKDNDKLTFDNDVLKKIVLVLGVVALLVFIGSLAGFVEKKFKK